MSARLLHVFSTFAPGGPQVRTARLLAELDPGWRHAILAVDGNTEARTLLPSGLGVELLQAPPRAGSARTALALARVLRRVRPDLLLTYNWGATDALLASRVVRPGASIHHEDGFRPDEVERFKRRRVLLRRALLPRTQGVIVPSFTLERIARELWKLPAELVKRIPNGIRVQDFPRSDRNPARRAELRIPPEAVLVGTVGHLRAEKNPVRAVVALSRLPADCRGVHLLVLGDGPERPSVEEAVKRLGLAGRVHLVGHRSSPQDDYRAMDLFLLPSDTEQMPVALLEAMASGLPVVSTDVGDVRSMLPDEQRRYLAPPDAERLAGALSLMLAARASWAELGARNRRRVEEEFSFERMARAYRETYERALGRPR